MIVPHPQGGDRAVHHGHGGCHEKAEDVDGSEEGTVRLRCQVSQVGSCNYYIVFHIFSSVSLWAQKREDTMKEKKKMKKMNTMRCKKIPRKFWDYAFNLELYFIVRIAISAHFTREE